MNERAVTAARAWIGTPYVHQASCRGAGTDCLGLIRGVWRDCVGEEPFRVPGYTRDWSEASGRERLLDSARQLLNEIAPGEEAPGDILVFRMREAAVAKHVGILSRRSPDFFIHAYDRVGVVESPLGPAWARRIVGRFRLP